MPEQFSTPATEPGPWSLIRRVLFRFAFIFWGRFCLQLGFLWITIGWTPGLHWLLQWPDMALDWPTNKLTALLTLRVFHLTGEAATRHQTGSGDTAQNWVGALALLLLAIVVSLVWTLISELSMRRRQYRVLDAWLHLAVRFTLASVLLGYGFSKVFPLQFSTPGSYILHHTYGDSSPMGLLWTFMGASRAYVIFAGLAEVIPALLLLFRRTATLGALAAAGVMLNVMLLNFCYDVPVKLFSTIYFVMAIYLLLPDMQPMARFLILRQNTRLTGLPLPRVERKALRLAGYALAALIVAHLIYDEVSGAYGQWRKYGHSSASASKQEGLDGGWIVDRSTGWPSGLEWKSVSIGSLRYQAVDYFAVDRADGQTVNYADSIGADHDIHFLSLEKSDLKWAQAADGTVTLTGTWKGQPALMTLHPRPDNAPPLLTRGFHWVQEYPYNR